MPQPAAYTTDDALPKSTLKARERDRQWHRHARCRGHDGHMKKAWVVAEDEVVDAETRPPLMGAKLIAMALPICRTCPVQWDCLWWALDVDERAGTWAVSQSDLGWLRRHPELWPVLQRADDDDDYVQVTVAKLRATTV